MTKGGCDPFGPNTVHGHPGLVPKRWKAIKPRKSLDLRPIALWIDGARLEGTRQPIPSGIPRSIATLPKTCYKEREHSAKARLLLSVRYAAELISLSMNRCSTAKLKKTKKERKEWHNVNTSNLLVLIPCTLGPSCVTEGFHLQVRSQTSTLN